MLKKLIILDRDGVINHDSQDYIKSPDEWRPLPNSLEAIALLTQHNFTIVVATNQSGLARGYYTEQTLSLIHNKMQNLLLAHNSCVEHIFYCPHGPDDNCTCRKPKSGLLDQIENFYQQSLKGTPFVGDSMRDIEAALAKGCNPILVRTGNGQKTLEKTGNSIRQVPVFDDLFSFAQAALQPGFLETYL
tara:strand:- start:18532 stop:19098 length:567 start_codon:yes stop_codon:yes gene_type:complete